MAKVVKAAKNRKADLLNSAARRPEKGGGLIFLWFAFRLFSLPNPSGQSADHAGTGDTPRSDRDRSQVNDPVFRGGCSAFAAKNEWGDRPKRRPRWARF